MIHPKIDLILSEIIRREGSAFTNDPVDPGGPTKYGITLRTLRQARGPDTTVHDLQELTEAEARDIYAWLYVQPFETTYGGDPDLLHLIVDGAVNHGVARMQGWLNEINSVNPSEIYQAVLRRRIRFYGRIITDRPSLSKYAAGWANRIAEFVR